MLAPYTKSGCTTVNNSTNLKTGGSKKKRGAGLVPYISSAPIYSIGSTLDNAISDFTGFLQTLDQDYIKSAKIVESVKIGNQRLITGGKKDLKKKVKKDVKKDLKKKIKKGGSNGSDFASTLNSRGPANAPDNPWGVPGLVHFRQFNKTGDYIPNSQLQFAATPLLAGKGNSNTVTGYDKSDLNYSFKY
jgi:hypothetical protein